MEWWPVADVPEGTSRFLEQIPLPAVMLDTGGAIVGRNSRFLDLVGGAPPPGDTGGFSFLDPADREMTGSLLRGMSGDGSITLRGSLLGEDGVRVRVLGFWSPMGEVDTDQVRYIGLFIEIPEGEAPHSPGGVSLPDIPAAEPGPARIEQARRDRIIHTIVFHDAKNRLAALHGYASLSHVGFPAFVIVALSGGKETPASPLRGIQKTISGPKRLAIGGEGVPSSSDLAEMTSQRMRVSMPKTPGMTRLFPVPAGQSGPKPPSRISLHVGIERLGMG